MLSLKILHVVNSIAPKYGGAGIAPKMLAFAQAKNGHDVTVCTTNTDYPEGTLTVPLNTSIYSDGISIFYFPASYRALLISFPMWKWLNSNIASYDIIHIHGLYRFPVTSAGLISKIHGMPYLITPHGSLDPFLYRQSQNNLFLKRIYERLFEIPNLNHASAIHYTTREEAQLTQFLNLRAKPVVVPNGIDWESYRNLPAKGVFKETIGISKDTKLVLYLGRINFKKGLDFLIPAFKLVAKLFPDARLAIVGPDSNGYASKVKKWCKEQQIIDRVCFKDYVSPDVARQAYVDADVFALPSYTENFGMTVVEAMACGCPVVISNRVNIWQEVRKAGAGLVVGLDSNELAEAIIKILGDKDAASAMGQCGRHAAQTKYAWPKIVNQLTGVYRDLIKNNASTKRRLQSLS